MVNVEILKQTKQTHLTLLPTDALSGWSLKILCAAEFHFDLENPCWVLKVQEFKVRARYRQVYHTPKILQVTQQLKALS